METLTILLAPYLKTLFVAFIVGCFITLFYLLPTLKELLKNIAEKFLGDKISLRVKDAMDKLFTVVEHVGNVAIAKARTDLVKALADGKIDDAEVKQLREDIAKEVMNVISPEIATLKNYLTGQALFDYIVGVVSSFMINKAKEKLAGNFLSKVGNQG